MFTLPGLPGRLPAAAARASAAAAGRRGVASVTAAPSTSTGRTWLTGSTSMRSLRARRLRTLSGLVVPCMPSGRSRARSCARTFRFQGRPQYWWLRQECVRGSLSSFCRMLDHRAFSLRPLGIGRNRYVQPDGLSAPAVLDQLWMLWICAPFMSSTVQWRRWGAREIRIGASGWWCPSGTGARDGP